MADDRTDDIIDLYDLGFHLWAKRRWVLLAGVLGALGGGLYGIFGDPVYESRAIISPNVPRSAFGDLMDVLPSNSSGVGLLETRLTSRSTSERVAALEGGVAKKIFPGRWDERNGAWENGVEPSVVSTGSLLRREHLEVKTNARKGVVEIIVTLPDSAYTKRVSDAYLQALRDGIQENTHKDLEESRKFLEAQIVQTADPLIQTRIQDMLARNIERATFNNPADFQVIEYPSYPAGKVGPRLFRSVVLSTFLCGLMGVFILAVRFFLSAAIADRQNRSKSSLN